MTTYFKNKEQYLTFRKAWANAVNDDRAKKKIVEVKSWQGGYERVKKAGWLTASHHLLFNILCNRPLHTGFKPKTKKNCLENGAHINEGLHNASWQLDIVIKKARDFIEMRQNGVTEANKRRYEYAKQKVEEFIEPFDGSITVEMLAEIQTTAISPIESNFGWGRQVAKKILSGEIENLTYEQLYDIQKQEAA